MKHSSLVIAAGCLIALFLGLILAYPLIVEQASMVTKPVLGVDVVYAYVGNPQFDANVTGLYRNYSIPQEVVEINGVRYGLDVHAISYLIVLNITNYSNHLAYITNFDIMLGPRISRSDQGSIQADNLVLNDFRDMSRYLGSNTIWEVNQSRLIYFSGVVGVHDSTYDSLNSLVYVYGHAEGRSYGGNAFYTGFDLKQVQFQRFGDDYLYNNLVNEEQMLIFYSGMEMAIGTRQQP
jgi:hypothetical protein